jgi:hypothetical protein
MNPTPKYLLVEPKTKPLPLILLDEMGKWAFELQGHEYQYVRGIVYPKIKPDEILISCIFSYHSKLYEETINHYLRLFPDAKITVGGVFPSLNPNGSKNGMVLLLSTRAYVLRLRILPQNMM